MKARFILRNNAETFVTRSVEFLPYVGETVEIAGFPQGQEQKTYQVADVHHLLTDGEQQVDIELAELD